MDFTDEKVIITDSIMINAVDSIISEICQYSVKGQFGWFVCIRFHKLLGIYFSCKQVILNDIAFFKVIVFNTNDIVEYITGSSVKGNKHVWLKLLRWTEPLAYIELHMIFDYVCFL